VLAIGRVLNLILSGLAGCGSVFLLLIAISGKSPNGQAVAVVWVSGGVIVCLVAAVVVHECGHLLTCLVFKVKVQEFRIGRADRRAFRFRFRGVKVWLGWPGVGHVKHDPVPARPRAAVILMSGSLANLVVAGALLAVALATAPHQQGTLGFPEYEAVELSLATFIGAIGLCNLLPFRSRSGQLSDGAKLLALSSERLAIKLGEGETVIKGAGDTIWRPATPQETAEYNELVPRLRQLGGDPHASLPSELVDKWLAAYRDRNFIGLLTAWAVGRALRKSGRVSELLELFEEYPVPSGRLVGAMMHSLGSLAYEVALVPGMALEVLGRVVDELQWLIDTTELADTPHGRMTRTAALHSLAVARLRQGEFAVVEDLCRTALAGPVLSATDRATVLATIALARQALGSPYEQLVAEATALDPRADLVAEAGAPSSQVSGS